ncbi:MAG: hypothetical protein K6G90_10460 [Clostridia bacterium]|nr:hypothetical protein [Clostridia bacterium]
MRKRSILSIILVFALLFVSAAPAAAAGGNTADVGSGFVTESDAGNGSCGVFQKIADWFRTLRDRFDAVIRRIKILYQKNWTNSAALTLPGSAATGEQVTALVNMGVPTDNYNYYVVDWGDGTRSYNGPYVYAEDWRVDGEVYHTYKKAGTYPVKACGLNLETGKTTEWSETQTLTVTGDDFDGNLIENTTPICSSDFDAAFKAKNISDGNAKTRWQCQPSASADSSEYVGFLLDDYYTLDTLEIDFPDRMPVFPSNVTVEYTTDGGKTWYMLPHYYYVLPNSEGLYDCVMKFPNPKGMTLSLPLDQIAANGIRFRGIDYLEVAELKYFSVAEMRVYGQKGTLLYTSNDGYYNADLSNMWRIFGTAKTEPRMFNSLQGGRSNVEPFRSGMTMIASIEWLAWNGMKLNWSDFDAAKDIHLRSLNWAVYGGDGWYYDEETGRYVVDESEYETNPRDDGFIWATDSHPMHLGEQTHYTNNSSLIIAARDYLLSTDDPEGFLAMVNQRGQVMLDKLRKAMDYMLVNLNGESGLMTIYDPRNDGTVHGVSSNYWDSLNCYGYNSAYENVFFYQAVLAMRDIEEYLGNTEAVERYTALAEKIRRVFNETFWDNEKGRYITSINVNGTRLDFGITFISFMAVAAGLASEEQAQRIYDWIDGKRIIEGDTSTGADIYNFKVAARSNTVAVETVEEDGLHYWWYNGHSFNDVLPGHWGLYGRQMQNGGVIFYTSYYDIAGRSFLSADNAMSRFNVIMDEFHKDSLRRDPRTQWGPYLVSINGEFPESGLVPYSFVSQIVGITPQVKGLEIKANLPSDMTHAGVREYRFCGRIYSIEVNNALTGPKMTFDGQTYVVKVPADGTYYITAQNEIIQD